MEDEYFGSDMYEQVRYSKLYTLQRDKTYEALWNKGKIVFH